MNNISSYIKKITLTVIALTVFMYPSFVLASLPAGFEFQTIASGFNLPTTLAFSNDGRIFVAEKSGVVRVIKNGILLSTPVISLSDVNTYGDRGLIGMAIDPNFSSNGYLYFLYTYENSPGFNVAGPKTARIVRVTVVGDSADESTKFVLAGTIGGNINTPSCEDYLITADCIPSDSLSHSAGGLRFGPDGKLYATLGDGASFDFADPKSLKAQNIDSLAGKMLRINKDGTAPTDNPFYNGVNTANRSKVFALGLRNAFRFNFRPTNGAILAGDVGWNTWEEVDLITSGGNYGWPCREGAGTTINGLGCTPTSTTTDPVYTYIHDSNGAGSVTAGSFPTGSAYPASYANTYFFGDYAQNWIKTITFDASNGTTSIQNFAGASDGTNGPVEFVTGPDGAIYFLSIYTGELKRINHTSGNRQPIAVVSANPTSGLNPLNVSFSSSGSSDPDNDPITFLWNFGDNATSSVASPTHVYSVSGTYNATLTVFDDKGGLNTKSIKITAGNQAPTVSINSPVAGFLYKPNDVISLSGSGTDLEDGVLSGASLSWRIILHHNTHIHVIYSATGTNPSFVAPDHNDPDVYVEVELTGTDSAGLVDKKSINIYLNNSSSSGNLILNPSVETAQGGNSSQPESWLTGFYGLLNPVFTYPVVGQDGLSAIMLEITSYTSGDAKWYFSPVSVSENTQYKFSDYYTSNVASDLTAQVALTNGTFSYIYLGSISPAATFTKIEKVFTTPVGAKSVTVFHALSQVGQLTTDNFILTQNSTTTSDTVPPTVAVTSPTTNQVISNDFTFIATSTDNVGVSGVTFMIDGVATSTEDVIAPYLLTLNTKILSNGPHSISARARDAANNTTTSSPVSFVVSNSVGTTTATTTTNLFVNGNVETISTTTPGRPYAWGQGGWGTSTKTFTYPTSGYSGNGMKVDVTSFTNGDVKWYPNDVVVVPGQIYDLTWQYKSNATTSSGLRYKSSTGTLSYPNLSTVIPPSTDWKKLSYRITIPAGMVKMTVFHLISSVGSLSTDEFVLSPVDNTAPSVSLLAPTTGQTISGNFDFTATSTDNIAVSNVKFLVDGNQIGVSTSSPYKVSYNSTLLTNGAHQASAVSSDLSGNVSTSTSISFNVSNSTTTIDSIPPLVALTNPTASSTVSGFVNITASSTDNIAVAGVQFKIDGINFGSEVTSLPYSISWNTTSTTNGTHSISAVARDTSNNKATSTITLSILNTTSTSSPNLILNGDFETQNGQDPLGWTRGGWGNGTQVYTYPATGQNGGKAAGYTVTNYVDGDVKWAFTPVNVSPGRLYRYSDYYKSSTITDVIGQYTLSDGTFAYFGLVKEIPGAVDWTQVTGDFTPPVGVTKVTLLHLISTNGNVTIDNASLIDIGATTTATDLVPPVVEFTSPLSGATLSGIINVTASSTDNVGVTYVVYALDGNIISTNLTTSPYQFAWDTTQVVNGNHVLKATTHDAAGNNSNIQIPITINNSVSTTTSGNIIDNPSFETAAANGDPQSWARGGWGTNDRAFSYPVPGRSTAKAAKVTITSYTNGDVKWFFNPKGVIEGRQYTFTDYYTSTATSDVTLRFTKSDGTFQYSGIANLPAAADWTQYQATFTVPASTTQITVFHSLSSVGTLTIDDYSLALIDTNNTNNQFAQGMVSLTFDDGWLSHYTNAMPILNTANLDGTFGVITQESIGAANETNRISNSSLESVDANGDPVDWQKGGWGTSSTTFEYPVLGHSGSNAAKITISNFVNGDKKWFFKDASIIPGQKYKFSDYYISDVPTEVTVRFNVGTSTNVYQYKYVATLPAASDWTNFTVSIDIPANAKSVTVFHLIQGNGFLTVDDYDLTRVQVYVTPAQILEMQAAGHEISSHTKTHASLASVSTAQMQDEIFGSKADLIALGINPVDTIIYPYGDYNTAVEQTSQSAGYIGARSVDRGYNDKSTDKFALKIQQVGATTTAAQIKSWIDVSQQTKTWLILMFHQVDLGGESLSTTPAILQDVVNYILSKNVPEITLKQGIQMMN